MDDDDVLEPNAFSEHVKSHTQHPQQEVSVLGNTGLGHDIIDDILMYYVTEICGYLFWYKKLDQGAHLGFEHFWGGRISCKRDFLLQSGGFNPIFKFGCEDIELGYRLAKRDLKVVYNPCARSLMIRKIDLVGFCERLRAQGSSQYMFSRMFPDDVVQKWCEMPLFYSEWPPLAPRLASILERAGKIDRLVRHRQQLGLTIDGKLYSILYAAYSEAFKASKLAGIAKMREAWSVVSANGRDESTLGSSSTTLSAEFDQADWKLSLGVEADPVSSKLVDDQHALGGTSEGARKLISEALCSRAVLSKQLYHQLVSGQQIAERRADKLITRALRGYIFNGEPANRSIKDIREGAMRRLTCRRWVSKQLALVSFAGKSRAMQNALVE
jgi:hypothetical protein